MLKPDPVLDPQQTRPPHAVRRPIDIEQLLTWAYGAELIAGTFTLSGMGDGAPGQLATKLWSASPPDDAFVVQAAVNKLVAFKARLVQEHARTGSRPDWKPLARHRLEPERDSRGRIVVEYEDDKQRRPILCRVVVRDRPETTHLARASYVHWHDALRFIRGVLLMENGLKLWLPTGPSAHPEPWLDTTEFTRAVIRAQPICA